MEAAKEKKLLKFVKRNHNGKTGALKQFFFSFIYVHVHVHVESSLSLQIILLAILKASFGTNSPYWALRHVTHSHMS